jgi:hypothetical protein
MGSDRTNTSTGLPGILVPMYDLNETHITSALGTDYTVADPEPGPATVSGTTSLTLEATGSLSSSATSLAVSVLRAGAPDIPQGAGAVKYVKSSRTYVTDAPAVATQWLGIDTYGGQPSLVVADDEHLVVCYQTGTDVTVDRRSTTGPWGNQVIVHSGTGPGCLCVAPDGSVLLYVLDTRLYVYRSTDYGATWTLENSDGLRGSVTSPVRIVASRDAAGAVALFVSTSSGATGVVTQYVSRDGGSQFVAVDTSADVWPTAAGSEDGFRVWDARLIGGFLHVVTGENPDEGRPEGLYLRRVASGAQSIFLGTPVLVAEPSAPRDWCCATIIPEPTGRLLVVYDGGEILSAYSDDNGETWLDNLTAVGPSLDATTGDDPGYPTGAWHRGGISLVVNDAGGSSGVTASGIGECRFGGHTEWPASVDMRILSGSLSYFSGWRQHYIPIATLAQHAWTASDTPTVTRSLSITQGQRIQTDGTGLALHTYDTGQTTRTGVWQVEVRVVAGTFGIECQMDGNNVRLDISATQWRFYDASSAATPWANHNIDVAGGEYVEVVIAQDKTLNRASLRYRVIASASGCTYERPWQSMTALTSLGLAATTTTAHVMDVGISSDVYIRRAAVFTGSDASILAADTLTDDNRERCAIPLSASPSWLADDVYVRVAGGFPRRDGVTHTFAATGPKPVRSLFPSRSRSPSVPWRGTVPGSGATAHAFELTPPRSIAPGVLGVYVDGCYGVESVDVSINGGTAVTMTLRQSFVYTRLAGGAIRGSTSAGGTTNRGYVRADQLTGWTFVDSGNGVRTIAGNSEGLLLSTNGAIAEKRAMLHVPSVAASGTGYLYHPRGLLLIHLGGATEVQTIEVTLRETSGAPTFSYMECGLIAVGEVTVLPVHPDLNESIILDDDSRTVTNDDGTRYSARRHRDRRRLTLSYVGSAHGTYQPRSSASPDFVTTYTSGAPASTWEAVPLIMEGTVCDLKGRPGLWVPNITRQSAVDATETILSIGANADMLWGPILGGWRREGLQYTGPRPAKQVWRVPVWTHEEEL